MTFWYTARNPYGPFYGDGSAWLQYKEWSGLRHLKELVSLDGILCDLAFEPDYENDKELWKYIVIEDNLTTVTRFFTSLDYVLEKVNLNSHFNLFTVVKEPDQPCENIILEGYEFVGYDLIDCYYDVSAITNCGGFDETFLPQDLNEYGLISDYDKAYDIAKRLLENNPDEEHADCYVFAVWRHKTIGRI